MGGGITCDKNIEKHIFNSSEYNIVKETCKNANKKNNHYKLQSKANYIESNILKNNQERKIINKRLSDFHNFEKKCNMKNMSNKISSKEGNNSSINENSFLIQRYNNNDEMNKNNNSSFFNGSTIFPFRQRNIEIIEEEKNDSIKNKLNAKILKKTNINNKQIIIEQKLKEKEDGIKTPDTGINYNLGENNNNFINISKGNSLINHNRLAIPNILYNFKSITPKMIMENENLEEICKEKKKLFTHFTKNNNILLKNPINNNKIIKYVFSHSFDMNRYNEEMLNVINSIRTNPYSFIKDIDYIINNNINKTDEGIFLISNEVDEKIKLLDNYLEIIEKGKNILKEMSESQEKLSKLGKLKYNDDLEIILDESAYEEIRKEEIDIKDISMKLNIIYDKNSIDDNIDINFEDDNDVNLCNENENIIDFDNYNEDKEKNKKIKNENNNDINNSNNNKLGNKIFFKPKVKLRRKHNYIRTLDLNDDKIANLILEKRKEIKNHYPKNIFKISVIKDIRINILLQISMEEYFKDNNRKTLSEIIFDPQYTNFAVSCTNEVNRNFISISCFA